MKIIIKILVEQLENKINREIIVDEKINLMDLCEFIIVSMNGNKIPFYLLEDGKITYYPYEIEESKYEKSLINKTLKELNIKKNKKINIIYDLRNFFNFNIIVDDIVSDVEEVEEKYFEVLSGKGYGIIDDEYIVWLKQLLNEKVIIDGKRYNKRELEYLKKSFNVSENNNKIKEYKNNRDIYRKSKRYIFNVSLKGFEKEIKRKLAVNNNVTINDFCKCIVASMNGDLSHGYAIKINKDYLDEFYDELELFYLNLKEKQKIKVIYDMGDNWTFNITVSKIINEYSDKKCEVLSGKGYGIIDDCGGVWGLSDIFNHIDKSWGKYNIDDFDLEKCNEILNKVL